MSIPTSRSVTRPAGPPDAPHVTPAGPAPAITLPPGCVAGVGSLPFVDADEAIRFVAELCPEFPFWPQLPQRCPHEGVIAQGLGALVDLLEPAPRTYCWRVRPGRLAEFGEQLDHAPAELIPASAAGFFAFESAIQRGDFPHAQAFKAQTEGPITLGYCLDHDGTPLIYRPGWLERLAKYLARQAVWQIRRLQALGRPVVFVVDEPAISLVSESGCAPSAARLLAGLQQVMAAVRHAGALAGLHCCAPLPLALLHVLPTDLLSFDPHLPLDGGGWFAVSQTLLRGNGYFGFGLVPTDPRRAASPADLFTLWFRMAAATGDLRRVAGHTLITASCGLGTLTAEHAAKTFRTCRQIGQQVAEFAESPASSRLESCHD